MLKITDLVNEAECYAKVRELRWGDGPACCPRCASDSCETSGTTKKSAYGKKYHCTDCGRHFNDLTDTIFAESNLPLKSWMCCLYLMNLNTSNRQISQELGIDQRSAQNMTNKIRKEVENNAPDPQLSGEVEFDEVYVVAGHKGHPESVKKKDEVVVEGD